MRDFISLRSFAIAGALLLLCLVAAEYRSDASYTPEVSYTEEFTSDVPTSNCEVDSRFETMLNRDTAIENMLQESLLEQERLVDRVESLEGQIQEIQADLDSKGTVQQGAVDSAGSRVSAQSPPVASPIVSSAPSIVASPVIVSSGPHWTYPGDITSHLLSGHAVDASNMSVAEQLSLHDSLHNSVRATTVRSSSSCPGGVCPPRQSTRIFRR
jgi:hypothetical protein